MSIPTLDLETLYVDDAENLRSQDIWSHIFGSTTMPNMKNLWVNGVSGRQFLQAFSPVRQSEQTVPPKFPSLQELSIEGWNFSEVADFFSCNIKTCLEFLKICLNNRREHRAAIKELLLTNCCHITEEDVEELKKIVKVTWDGIENLEKECYYCGCRRSECGCTSSSDSDSDSESASTDTSG
jgi:hypothetical protein